MTKNYFDVPKVFFGLTQYSTIVVKRNYISGFEHFPKYSNSSKSEQK